MAPAYAKLLICRPQPGEARQSPVLPGDAARSHAREKVQPGGKCIEVIAVDGSLGGLRAGVPDHPAHRGSSWKTLGFCLPQGSV